MHTFRKRFGNVCVYHQLSTTYLRLVSRTMLPHPFTVFSSSFLMDTLVGCDNCWRCHFTCTSIYVLRNLRICAILRLCCTFSESWDCIEQHSVAHKVEDSLDRLHRRHIAIWKSNAVYWWATEGFWNVLCWVIWSSCAYFIAIQLYLFLLLGKFLNVGTQTQDYENAQRSLENACANSQIVWNIYKQKKEHASVLVNA